MATELRSTKGAEYTARLLREEQAGWKQLFDRQAIYRRNLLSLDPGFVLDVGCGLGRNLQNLRGNGVGLDNNADSVRVAATRGFKAFTPDTFQTSEFARPERFDSLLLSHVLEHLTMDTAVALVSTYLPYVRKGGKIIIMTPQKYGHRADPTHVTYMDYAAVQTVFERAGVKTATQYSFPFPRFVGAFFRYNEFVSVGTRET